MNDSKGMKQQAEKIAVASVSAAAAEATTFPIDLIKTRIQFHGKASASDLISGILKNDGVFGMYKGLSPAIVRHLFYTPIRIVGYEYLRNSAQSSSHHSLSLPTKALIGGVSGVMAQVLASPADLVKVRMQADGCFPNRGLQPRYSGFFHALTKIFREERLGGLWKGAVPNAQRAFLVNMGELACYDQAKHFIIRNRICNDNIYAHTLSSMVSGLSATTLSCPADVVKTRMMNQGIGKNGDVKYKSSYDCLVKTVKIEGFRALWKGFFPTWARLGPWQFVFWVSYERIRQIAGITSF